MGPAKRRLEKPTEKPTEKKARMPRTKEKNKHDTLLLLRIENLIQSFQKKVKDAEGQANEDELVYGLRALVALANMILHNEDIFGIEPWHVVVKNAPLSQPGEMLLRVKDFKGKPMPPYPAIMAFYQNGYTADIDTVLFLAALRQFQSSDEKQVSINISARSLRDPDFVKTTLKRLENLELNTDEKIIIEIHESTPNLSMSRQVLDLYKGLGVSFAIDDVGLNMNDVMRLSEFEGLAEYIKIDRSAVCAKEDENNALKQVVSFIRTLMPSTIMVAEGVKNAQHAFEIKEKYADIAYVQGLYLSSDRKPFANDFHKINTAKKPSKKNK